MVEIFEILLYNKGEVIDMYMDFHCDTLMHTWERIPGNDIVENNRCSLDLTRLTAGKVKAQFFGMFMLGKEDFQELGRPLCDDRTYLHSLAEDLFQGLQRVEGAGFARNFTEYSALKKEGKTACFLTIEDGRYLTTPERIEEVFDLGVRLVTLTWNYDNSLGHPNARDPEKMAMGLTSWGKEAVERMNDLGILIDVSHLSDGGFYDVLRTSKKPFLASHSNARGVTNHPRNLTDDMIRALAEAGGISGLNFCPIFLEEYPEGVDRSRTYSRVEAMVAHLRHMYRLGGEGFPAIGTDFDGVSGNLEIDEPGKMEILWEALRKEGFSERILEGFFFKNGERLLRDVEVKA